MSSNNYPKPSDDTSGTSTSGSIFTRDDDNDTHKKNVEYECIASATTKTSSVKVATTNSSTTTRTTTDDNTNTNIQEQLDQQQQQQQQHTFSSPKSFPLQTQKQNHPIQHQQQQQSQQQQQYPSTRKPPLLPKQLLVHNKNNNETPISRKTNSRRMDRTNKNNNASNNSHNDSKHNLMRSKSSNDDFNDLLRLDQLLLSTPEKTTTTKLSESIPNLSHLSEQNQQNINQNQHQPQTKPQHYSDSTRRRVLSRHRSSDPSTEYVLHQKQQHQRLLKAPSPNSKRVNDITKKLRDSSFTLNIDCEQQQQLQQQQQNILYDSFWYDNDNNQQTNNDNHDTILDDVSISSKTREVKLLRNHSVPFHNSTASTATENTTTATKIAAITATATTIYNTLRRYKSSQICIPNQLQQQQQQQQQQPQQQQIVQLNGNSNHQQQQHLQNQKLQKQKLVQRIWKVCSTFCCTKDKYITMFIGIALIVQIIFLLYVNIQYVTIQNNDSNIIFTNHNVLLSSTSTNTTRKDTTLNTIQSNMSIDQDQRVTIVSTSHVKVSSTKEDKLQHLETQSISENHNNNNNNNRVDSDTIKNNENDLTTATLEDENDDEHDINNELGSDLLDLYYLDDDNDVDASYDINNVSPPVLCMIRVLGSCSVPGMEWLPYYGWFEDKELSNNLYYPYSISTIVQKIVMQQHTTTKRKLVQKQHQHHSTTSWFRRWRNLNNRTRKAQQQHQKQEKPYRRVFVQTKIDCYTRQQFWNATCIPTIIPHSTVQMHYDNDKYSNISIHNHETYLKEQINAQQQWKGSSTTMTNISTIPKSTLFQPYIATCKLRISGGNAVTKECQEYFSTVIPKTTHSDTSSKENNDEQNTDDTTNDDTRIIGGWFDDSLIGNGPKPSTWWNCRQRRRYWIEFCSISKYDTMSFVDTTATNENENDNDVVTVEMDYTGPGIPTNIKEDGSWEIIDIDSTTLHFMPTTIVTTATASTPPSSYQSCYRMTRKPALPFVPHVDFCYPTINIIGIDTRFTTSGSCNNSTDCQWNTDFGNLLSSILTNTSQSTKVLTANPSTNYCRIVNDKILDNDNDLHEFPLDYIQESQLPQQHQRTYYRYFHGFAIMTKEIERIHNKWKYNKLQTAFSLDDNSHDDDDDHHNSNDVPPTTILVNVCNSPEEVMEYDVLLNGPKSLIVYIVQDVTTKLYSEYLHSQLNLSMENAKSASNFHSMILSANNITVEDSTDTTLIRDPHEDHFKPINTNFKAMLHQNRISNYYSRYIKQIETSIPAQFVHLISAERLQSNANDVKNDLSAILHTRLGYNLPELDTVTASSASVKNDHMDGIDEKRQLDNDKDDINVLTETKDLIGHWWDECLELSKRTKYTYPHCHTSGYVKSKQFVKRKNGMSSALPIQDLYLSVWSDQITSWFGQVGQSFEMTKLTSFLKDAKDVGFSSVLTDIGWTMTTPGTGDAIQFHNGMTKPSFDLLSEVCEQNMSLHIVLTTHQLPNWIQSQKKGSTDYFNETDASSCTEINNNPHLSSFLDAKEWELRKQYIMFATETLLHKYGTCIHSITPSISGEHRFSATHIAIRSNTTSVYSAFRKWQLEKKIVNNIKLSVDPPELNCGTQCQPIIDQQSALWFGFQETILAEKYIELCTVVVNSTTRMAKKDGYKNSKTTCSIRIVGDDMFSTSIAKGSNILFRLLKAPSIKDVTVRAELNTNNGVPLSPSIIAMLLGAIHPYGKKINFEASVSPFVTCDNTHEGVHVAAVVSRFHFKTWLQYALDATVHGIGFSDLCSPLSLIRILKHETFSDDLQSSQSIDDNGEVEQVPAQVSKIRLQTSSTFGYSALIYYPYRALYAWSSVISGETCGTSHSRCWHSSLEQHDVVRTIESHGLKTLPYSSCSSDHAQNELIQVWDNLRIEHEHVAIFGDVDMLSEDVLNKVDTIISITYPCVMTSNEWNMYEGEITRQTFLEKSTVYDFHQHLLNMPNTC